MLCVDDYVRLRSDAESDHLSQVRRHRLLLLLALLLFLGCLVVPLLHAAAWEMHVCCLMQLALLL